jgi:spore germination protein GerM
VIRRVVVLTTLSALAIIVAACGVPSSSELERIRPADGFGLASTTSSTTTTSTTTTTIGSTTTSPELTTSTMPITTAPPPVEIAKLYFVLDGRLFGYEVPVPANPTTKLITETLVQGVPPGEPTNALTTLLPFDAITDVEPDKGVAYVSVSQSFADRLQTSWSPAEQSLAFGQIVLTVLQGQDIGQVVFRFQGEGFSIVDGNGSTIDPGVAVAAADYANLIAS